MNSSEKSAEITEARGAEAVPYVLRIEMTPIVAEVAERYPKDDHSEDAELARMALEWVTGKSVDVVAAQRAYRAVSDAAYWLNYRGQGFSEYEFKPTEKAVRLQKLADEVKPYFVTTYKTELA